MGDGVSDKQIAMLRHAVGADTKNPGYRNRYCTSVNDLDALALVESGLMEGPKYENSVFGEGHGLFFVTDKGLTLLGIKETL
jgi:hypothetical protein